MQSTLATWGQELELLHAQLGSLFKRPQPHQRSLGYLKGLLSSVECKNSWQLAEWMGKSTPDGVQHLLEHASRDADAARDMLRNYVVERFGDREGMLIVDETGFIKKGELSAGMQRQYSGTGGRIENSQIAVVLCYAGADSSTFIDRQLHVPRQWCDNRPRCHAAGIPDQVGFATKPQMARQMTERAPDAGVPCAWVTGDEVYGGDRNLRMWLQEREQPFVLAAADERPRDCSIWRLQITGQDQRDGQWGHYLLARRSFDEKRELAYCVVYAPQSEGKTQKAGADCRAALGDRDQL